MYLNGEPLRNQMLMDIVLANPKAGALALARGRLVFYRGLGYWRALPDYCSNRREKQTTRAPYTSSTSQYCVHNSRSLDTLRN